VVRAELDLAREIEYDISVLPQLFQLLIQPVKVLVEVLYAIQQPPVRTETVCVHDILEGDEGRDVDRAGVWDVVVRWVKVYDGYRSIERSEELVFAVAVSRFTATWRTNHDLAERHFAGEWKEGWGDQYFSILHDCWRYNYWSGHRPNNPRSCKACGVNLMR
jgi:hypothetical protein